MNNKLVAWLNSHGFTTGGYSDKTIEVMTTKETEAEDEKRLRVAMVKLGVVFFDGNPNLYDPELLKPYTQVSIRCRDGAYVVMLGNVTDTMVGL